MLTALCVIFGLFFTLQLTPSLRIGFSDIPILLSGFFFGPVVGGAAAVIGDLLKFLLKPTGPFFFGFTLNAALEGIFGGLFLYKRPVSIKAIILCNLVISVVVHLFLGTLWLSLLYGKGFFLLLPPRILKEVFRVPISCFLLYPLLKACHKARG